jgi:phosphoribosylformylglycinamidine synthase I
LRIGVLTFPGSLDDVDAARAVRLAGGEPVALWHADHDLKDVDAVILPGGFSYGDYLRAGAIAARAPRMQDVVARANDGMPVLGICNGFQILVESGLLPGALLRNRNLRFVCRPVTIRVETTNTPFTCAATKGQLMKVPVAHGEGCYFADQRTLDTLEAEDRVVMRYLDNPNGSLRDIAGICSEGRNVMGMMPHPERAADPLLGSTDGRVVLESMVRSLVAAHA